MTNELDWDSWIRRKKPVPEIKSVPTVTSVTEVTKEWDWNNWTTTEGFPVSTELMDWVIGQDKAIEETKLCIDEWINKLLWLKKKEWWKDFEDPKALKPQPKDWLPVGPYLLLLGDAGTGKSLLGRAMSSYMTKLYKEKGLKLYDVLSWKNSTLPSEPKISIHPSGTGKEIVYGQTKKEKKKSFWGRWGFKLLVGTMIGFGLLIIGTVGFHLINNWVNTSPNFMYNPFGFSVFVEDVEKAIKDGLITFHQYWASNGGFVGYLVNGLVSNAQLLYLGIGSLSMGAMLFIFKHLLGNASSGQKGIGGATSSNSPKLLIDNSSEKTPFIDSTGHGSAQLFGSIAWDPYQELSEDMEVLTNRGWKFIGEITINDEVATLRDGKYLEWNKPYGDFIKEQYEGKMVHVYSDNKLNNGSLDILVHPEHRLLVKEENRWIFKKAKDCVDTSIIIKKDVEWISDKTMDKNMVELWGWFITEGSSYPSGYHKTVKFTQKKKKTRKEIMDLLRRMKISFNTTEKDIKISHNVQLYNIFHKLGHQEFRYIPQELKDLNSFYLKILLNTMISGDGTRYNDGTWRYYTCSKRLADDVQEIALKLGLATVVKQTSPSQTGRKQWYVLSVKSESKAIPKYVNYFGMIRCLAVKNETLYVRRNGKTAWCGNTGGLGTPEHQRVTAGDVHRAHLGILYIDELKNLTGQEAITLLTVLEDAQLPIALRSQFHGGDTAAMSVSTEPIPTMVFFIGAGNLDSLENIHPALLDRIQGYGKVIYMNNDMSNTEENRRKVIQFIAQEIKRFNLLPFDREACEEIIAEFRRKSGFKNKLTTKFRPMISIIKTASTLTTNESLNIVNKKHVDEAIKVHCKNIGMQILERQVEKQKLYHVITPSSKPKKGQIFGLAVLTSDSEDVMVGSVLPIRASMIKCELVKLGELIVPEEGYFHVTGVETVNLNSWVQHSISKVVHVFAQKYKINLSKYKTHIDFAQSIGIDGPSAGVTMALALISIYKNKKIRQDVAVTGEINIGIDGKIEITPIGGVHEKIMAAQEMGIKKVLIPKRNYEININPVDYTIEVVGCATLEEYMREILV